MKKLSYDILSLKEQLLLSKQEEASDNSRELEQLKRSLTKIIQNELTPRQREIIDLYYYHNLNTVEIAKLLHINKYSVSRTKRLAMKTIKRFLQYSFH